MDFLHNALGGGCKFRSLSIEDAYTWEMPVIEVDISPPAPRVVRVLERLRLERGLPDRIIILPQRGSYRSLYIFCPIHRCGNPHDFRDAGKNLVVGHEYVRASSGMDADEKVHRINAEPLRFPLRQSVRVDRRLF